MADPTDTERLHSVVAAQKEYVEFLEEACRGPEGFAAIHGMTVSKETFEKGERLRAAIDHAMKESSL